MTLRMISLSIAFLSLTGCATFHTTNTDTIPGRNMDDYVLISKGCTIYHKQNGVRFDDPQYYYSCMEKHGYHYETTVRTNYNPFSESFWTGTE